MIDLIFRTSLRACAALDHAAMSIAYGDEAAAHYGEPYTALCGLRDWLSGLAEGWRRAA